MVPALVIAASVYEFSIAGYSKADSPMCSKSRPFAGNLVLDTTISPHVRELLQVPELSGPIGFSIEMPSGS